VVDVGFPQNAYPNLTNFPSPSFPQEVTPPDVDPDVDMLCVRYNPAWSQVLLSACNQLTQLSSWIGTDDEKKLAVNRATNLAVLLQTFMECDMSGCCYDVVAHRVTSGGELQISVNGGEWQPDPDDPRITAVTYPPIVMDETHTKCDAATNASVHIQGIISETSSQLGGTGSIIEIAAAIALAIFALFLAPESIPALAPVILPLIAGLLFVGQAAWDAYFDDTVDLLIVCALFCNIQDDGTFTQAGYDGFIAQLGTDLPASPAKDMFISLMARIGLVGLNDYAAIGTSADADCSDCVCGDSCDLEQWQVTTGSGDIFGNIVSRDESTGTLVVETTGINTNFQYYIDISTSQLLGADSGCYWVSPNVVVDYQEKGSAFSGVAFLHGFVENKCVNHIQTSANAPFTLTIQFGKCP
jgi:hypothetical protein